MSAIDLDRFRATPLARDPYEHIIVPGFLTAEGVAAIDADYPRIAQPGSFPVEHLTYGDAFRAFLEEMQGPAVEQAFAEKFDVALAGKPTAITARGQCQARDGRIHTDTESKIITVLVYMNTEWSDDGGRLRVLRSPDDLEDFAAEVPPDAGTLLAFRRSERSWHGHRSHVGPRRVIQMNWLTDAAVARRERRRHRLSAWFKRALAAAR